MRFESDANALSNNDQPELPFEQPEGRCGSCGGPAVDNELCSACREAFSSLLGDAATPAADEALPLEAALALTTDTAPASSSEAVVAAPVASAAPSSETVVAAPVATTSAQSVVADRPRAIRPELAAVAAVAIVAVVGIPFGASWLRDRLAAQNASVETPAVPAAAVAKETPVVVSPSVPAAAPAAPATQAVEAESPALPPPVPAARPASVAPARAARVAAAARKIDPQPAPPRPAAPSLDLSAVRVASLAPPATTPQPPVPEPQQAVTAEPPAGRLFDMSEVDEPPHVASKVDPRLPGELAGRPVNDVVVVRILVSQTGHPFRVNLLRRSKLGSSVDEAVVSAVKQWTFSPARKRGEVVSCWYNFGVSLAN